jgi:hypothetical protein
MITAFSKWWFALNHRVVEGPTSRRIATPIRLRQDVYNELVRDITKLLEKEDNMQITLLTSGYEKTPPVSEAPKASRTPARQLELAVPD